jgi:hypothetical protein
MGVEYTIASTEAFSAVVRNDRAPEGSPSTLIRSLRRGRTVAKWILDIELALARKGMHPLDVQRCKDAIEDHAFYAEMTS